MTLPSGLRQHTPSDLIPARSTTHLAVQFATRAARANLPAQPDDSHSNLGWDNKIGGLISQPIEAGTSVHQIGVGFTPLRLIVLRDHQEIASTNLAGMAVTKASEWLDAQLSGAGLKAAGPVELPYKLPPEVAALTAFDTEDQSSIATLAAWFAFAHDALSAFAERHAQVSPGPSPVRNWPHHFDIATYVALEPGDPETAKGIGVGLSPGDESIHEPYFYINPWPRPGSVGLPDIPDPGHWNTEGFVGMAITASELLAAPDNLDFANHIDNLFATGRSLQGC